MTSIPAERPRPARRRRSFLARSGVQEAGMLAPACLLILVFLVLPFALSFYLSLTNERLIPRPTPSRFVGFDNYARALTDAEFWQAVWNVARFTLMVIPLQCGLALGTALLINRKMPFRNLFRSMFFLPTITSMVVVCVIWSTLYQYPTGPLNQILGVLSFGLAGPVDWLGDPSTAMPAIVLLSAWQAFGFQMIIYLAGLQNISGELYEAARVDGAGPWRQFWNVTMPGLRETHVFVLIITTIQAFKLFTQIDILTQGGPLGSTETVVHHMVTAGFAGQRIGYASAVSVLLFLFVLVVSLTQRYITRDRAS